MQQALTGLAREHRVLLRQYGEIQSRCSALIAAQAAEIGRLQAETVRLRGALVVRQTALAIEREQRIELEVAIPGLPRRLTLARRVETLLARVQELMRERLGSQKKRDASDPAAMDDAATLGDLREKSVLCVGSDGRGSSVARKVVERAGGHFSRHGGDDANALESSLVAADLVICQTGCVSHDAYWRVQDHCRRTGKQCVLVDQPQAMRFVRSLPSEPETLLDER